MFRRVATSVVQRRAVAAMASASLHTAMSCTRAMSVGGAPPAGGRPPVDMRRPEEPVSAEVDEEEAMTPPEPAKKPENPPKFFTYEVDEQGFCTISLSRKPVNSFSLEFFEEFNEWMSWMGDNDEMKAVILTSSIPGVFSAGLDINELHNPKEDRFGFFWSSFQHFFVILNAFPKPLICAINGNSPAGGCIMAIGCDYRIMVDTDSSPEKRPFRIGLNETKLGIPAPRWVMKRYAEVVGHRNAERMLQLGETPTAVDALKLGLVDEICSADEIKAKALLAAKKYASIESNARYMTRRIMREDCLAIIGDEEGQRYDIEATGSIISHPDVQKSLTTYLERLSKGRAKK
jgi:3,2-trans-enoyl-CoA isomerase